MLTTQNCLHGCHPMHVHCVPKCHVHWSYLFCAASIEFSAWERMSTITTTNYLWQLAGCKSNFTVPELIWYHMVIWHIIPKWPNVKRFWATIYRKAISSSIASWVAFNFAVTIVQFELSFCNFETQYILHPHANYIFNLKKMISNFNLSSLQ